MEWFQNLLNMVPISSHGNMQISWCFLGSIDHFHIISHKAWFSLIPHLISRMIFATDSPKTTIFRFSNLWCNLHYIKQGDWFLSQYFIALKILWDELGYLRTTPSCSCIVPCTCDFAKAGQSYKHMEYVSCFLKGLSDNYQNIRIQILLLNLIPSIKHIYSLIAQQEVTSPYPFTFTLVFQNLLVF